MIARPPLPPGPYLVVGLARSGLAAALALRAVGEAVAGVDGGAVAPGSVRELAAAGVAVHEHSDGVGLLEDAATVVKSPGVPAEAPVVAAARARGMPVLGELELGWRLLPQPVIAITGSNGKTTTTELVGHIHREAGLAVAVAGNVGTALTSLAGRLAGDVVVVCEASSFQLEDTVAFAPDAAVLLNLAPDHLDRHGTFAAYREAKLRVLAHQPPEALAVLPAGLATTGRARRVTFASPMPGAAPGSEGAAAEAGPATAGSWAADMAGSGAAAAVGGAAAADVTVANGRLAWRGEPVIELDEIRLRGAHNLENAMAAAAVTLARGIEPGAVAGALAGFGGVAHRLEEVTRRDGVLYVDDSKATNVASSAVGLRAFPGGVHAILGGRGKQEDYAPLAAAVAERARAAYLIGEEAGRLGAALQATGVPLHNCEQLERAVAAARAAARPGEVVLLSPACASYDQYRSFEERGEHFKALVRA